jgi:hypothetical protein
VGSFVPLFLLRGHPVLLALVSVVLVMWSGLVVLASIALKNWRHVIGGTVGALHPDAKRREDGWRVAALGQAPEPPRPALDPGPDDPPGRANPG